MSTTLLGPLVPLSGVSLDPIDWPAWYKLLLLASGGACAYHGYKRNERGDHPVAWAVAWWILGSAFFPITPIVAVAEGFAKPKKR